MGIAERKERHKEDIKKRILEAAKELFLEKGFEATSMRNIAEKVEFSPTALYLYFKEKNDIIYSLHQEGFRMLSSNFQVLAMVSDPMERLKAMGRIYIKFALENSDFYELMFIMKEPLQYLESCAEEQWSEGEKVYGALHSTVLQCQQNEMFKDIEPHGLSLMIWSTMHGLCTMKVHGHLDHMTSNKNILPEVKSKIDYVYEIFITVLERLG
jgi:AcrR family transcriptional regulator